MSKRPFSIAKPVFYTGTCTHFSAYGFMSFSNSLVINSFGFGYTQIEADKNAERNFLNSTNESDEDSMMLYGVEQ